MLKGSTFILLLDLHYYERLKMTNVFLHSHFEKPEKGAVFWAKAEALFS